MSQRLRTSLSRISGPIRSRGARSYSVWWMTGGAHISRGRSARGPMRSAVSTDRNKTASPQKQTAKAYIPEISAILFLHRWEDDMTAFDIVGFRVKRGHQDQFPAGHRGMNPRLKGFRGGYLVRSGEDLLHRRVGELPEDRRRTAPHDRHSRRVSRTSRRPRRRAWAHRSGFRRGSSQTSGHQGSDEENARQENDQTKKAPLALGAIVVATRDAESLHNVVHSF